jgi:hypothetical protein
MEANKKSYPGGFERVQEHENGIALDEQGRPFLEVLDDWHTVLGYVATDCKDYDPYTQFHRDLRNLSLEAQAALVAIKKLLKKRDELWPGMADRVANTARERLNADPVAEGLNLLPMYSRELDEGLTDGN